jgi:hypothetical protein
MPTPRSHGGAQLFPINLTSPGFAGLNTERAGSILDPAWATTLDNAVFDAAGRPSLRNGFLEVTTAAVAGTPKHIFEHFKSDGSSEVVTVTTSSIFRGTTTLTDISGTATVPADGHVKLVNFNDKMIAFGTGTSGLPQVYTGSSFADITVNSQVPLGTPADPNGTVGTAAFGRLWIARNDGHTLQYSALLDETRWDTADGGGLIDFSKVWPAGQDQIVAVTEFGGDLVVFGSNNTVICTDGAGASLGIDPTALYVSDTLPGVGAISQYAMTRAAGDFWFLSPAGIMGLKRELVQRSTPLTNISSGVQSFINALYTSEADFDDITIMHDPNNDFVVCNFPSSDKQIVFDTRQANETGTYRTTTWSADLSAIGYVRETRTLYGGLNDVAGKIFSYAGFSDNGTSYAFDYDSGWLDLGLENAQYLKFVKYLSSYVLIEKNVAVTHKVGYDFGVREYSISKAATGSSATEFNIAEFTSSPTADPSRTYIGYKVAGDSSSGESEFSGSFSLRTLKAPGQGSGQYIRVGIRLDTNSGSFALQQLNLYAKLGRMAV